MQRSSNSTKVSTVTAKPRQWWDRFTSEKTQTSISDTKQSTRNQSNWGRTLNSSREQRQEFPGRAGQIQLIWQLKKQLILQSAEFQSLSWRLWAEVEPETFTHPSAILAGICIPIFFPEIFQNFTMMERSVSGANIFQGKLHISKGQYFPVETFFL